VLESFCVENGLSLMEAMEIVFPPSPYEIDRLSLPLREIYTKMTLAFGPFAQGPAAIGARYGDLAVCSLDTLGLRPLWFSETEKEYVFSSERGAIPLEEMVSDSRPLSPGEKMACSFTAVKMSRFFHTVLSARPSYKPHCSAIITYGDQNFRP
jgi:glutamate synthase (NADPH/NADH) large chain